jgi:ABC-type antimicrobial peptide transport system permease subunit
MSETFFSINDLLRRKLQTRLTILGMGLSVGSTVFLLLFADRMDLGISLRFEGSLTMGLSSIFSNFLVFIALLIFMIGAAVTSFMSSMMMGHRVRDIGLIRAAGCPSDVLFGYFFNELMLVTLASCFLGSIVGIVADFASTVLFSTKGLEIAQKTPNLWLVLPVFVAFFMFALIFGTKPILSATRVSPAEVASPKYYLGLTKETVSRVLPKSNLTFRMAIRNLSRYSSVTFRVVLCLTIVFVLVTVAVAGGTIVEDTTISWIESPLAKDVVLIAHMDMCNQYTLLMSRFRGPQELVPLNYTAKEYSVSQIMLDQLNQMRAIGVVGIDSRLVIMQNVTEVSGYVYDNDTQSTVAVGDSRRGDSLVVGIDPDSVTGKWFMQGEFLKESTLGKAVVGDSLALKMFKQPLVQDIMMMNSNFHVVGVCVDPINNGKVTYVHITDLENISGVSGPNIVLVKLDPLADRSNVLNRLKSTVAGLNGKFEVLELREIVEKNSGFLGYVWSRVVTIQLLALAAAVFCLTDYVALTTSQQKVEFGILRAVGGRPRAVLKIVAAQNVIVLLSSFGVGVEIGLMFSLLFLVQKPSVSVYGILEIFGGMLSALAITFVLSLYLAVRFSRKPILELIREP